MLMARLSELTAVIADVHGVPEPSVVQIARHLREAGLLSQGGRGLSAAHMTAADAANLLIAVNAAPIAKDAPTIVSWYQGMISDSPPLRVPLGGNEAERRFLRSIAFVADHTATFGDGLQGLLTMAAEGKVRKFLHNVGLLHIATEPLPHEKHSGISPDFEAQRLRDRVRAALAKGSDHTLAPLRKEMNVELNRLIRTGVACVLVRFGRPYPSARIEVRRGGWNFMGQPEGGECLINAAFRLDFEDDAIWDQEDHFHALRFLARSELVTIDQRALLAVGEVLSHQQPQQRTEADANDH
jgi:hypothetical protein